MKKYSGLICLGILLGGISLSSCGDAIPPINNPTDIEEEKKKEVYYQAVANGAFSGTYQEWQEKIIKLAQKPGKIVAKISLTTSSETVAVYLVTYTDGTNGAVTIDLTKKETTEPDNPGGDDNKDPDNKDPNDKDPNDKDPNDKEPSEETFESWKASDKAYDYTGDKFIREDDYEIYKKFTKWVEGDEANDLNNDEKIDYSDYLIHEEYLTWKLSINAGDYNKDGKTNWNDYYCFTKFGEYQILNYVYDSKITIIDDNSKIAIHELDKYLPHIKTTWGKTGLVIKMDEELTNYLGETAEVYKEQFKKVNVDSTTFDDFNFNTNVLINNLKFDIKLYFNKKGEGLYSTSVKLVVDNEPINIAFDVQKVETHA